MRRLSKLSRSIVGSVAIVTGAASGMGRATAHLFADEGARLAIFDINEAALEAVAEEVRSVGAEVLPLVVNLRDRQAVEKAFSLELLFATTVKLLPLGKFKAILSRTGLPI